MHFSVELHAGFSYKEGSLVVLSLPAQVSGDVTIAFDSPSTKHIARRRNVCVAFDVIDGYVRLTTTVALGPFQRGSQIELFIF